MLTRFFFFNDTAPTEIYTLSLHDALPILRHTAPAGWPFSSPRSRADRWAGKLAVRSFSAGDRKSTRLNSSHSSISYAVFCLKKKIMPDLRIIMCLLNCNCTFMHTLPLFNV